MRFTLRGARLVDATTDMSESDITIDGTRIQAVGRTHDAVDNVIDAVGSIVMPGFIDVHTHGGGGFNLHTTNAEEIHSYTQWVTTTGVTSFLIGVVGVPSAIPEEQLKAAATAIEDFETRGGQGAKPLGIHLEGPYINVKRRGAHLPSWLRTPSEAETEHVLALANGHLRLITLAPEIPGASAMIRRMLDAGVTVSMGHTDADYEQACEAIQLGVTHVTHCFNAMRPIHHRSPGLIEAIVEAEQVRGELIADGVHVHPAVMDVLVKLLGPQRTIVITDALAGAGIPDGVFEFAGQAAQVICGAARLADGTLTGSVLTMDQALRNMLEITKVSLPEAVGMLTINPALSIKAAECRGLLRNGFDADLLIFDTSLNLQATICRGTMAFATDAWRERLAIL
jgi:N-acetylglucosamine-6-phosphate deacetylase